MADTRKGGRGWILGIIIFMMGGCGLAYEYTFSKIAADLLGNSVQQWAIVIAIMLFCMGMGAEIQRLVSNKRVISFLLGSQLLLALLGGFGPLLMLWSFAHFPIHFGLVYYGLVSVIGTLIGFEIPLITRINEDYSEDIRANLARVLKMDYIGALVGALFWIFVLPVFFSLHEISYVLAMITVASTLLCWFFFGRGGKSAMPVLACLGLTVAMLGFGMSRSDRWSFAAEQALYMDKVIFSTTTKYQHIVLTESRAGHLRCYINGHIQFSSTDEAIYHENLVHPAMQLAGSRKRILVLGGGDGMAVREILKYPEVQEIVLVDLDPEMTRLAAEHPILSELNGHSLSNAKVTLVENQGRGEGEQTYQLELPNQRRMTAPELEMPQLTIINLDASSYVNSAAGMFDVIILDFPDPSSPDLAKLYSAHFYGALKGKLAADGIMVQQSTSPYRAKEAFLCIGRTMESVGYTAVPYHDHVPSFGEWGWWIASHSSQISMDSIKQAMRSVHKLPADTRYLTPALISNSLDFGKGALETEYRDVTTISHSAVLEYYLQGWKE
ncbi:polyamine aminopropyltransferase [Rubritalea halochordaticola]|uniref:Polyamine aminopropyltransferase n=1 Tax=Rubritalea halochordaticola TaxID=714537 RepID=A0ABP9V295_9BACT